MSKIFPDNTNSKFDIKYARRRILGSDLIRNRNKASETTITRIREQDDAGDEMRFGFPGEDDIATEDRTFDLNDFLLFIKGLPAEETANVIFYNEISGKFSWGPAPSGTGGGGGLTDVPDDEEHTATVGGGNIDNFEEGTASVFLTNFVGFGVRIFRNNILQSFVTEYTWNYITGEIVWNIAPIAGEIFTIHGYSRQLPDDEEHTTTVGGGNVDNVEEGNVEVFLTNFNGRRIRLFRNNVLQSFVTEYSWNKITNKLTLVTAPIAPEIFTIQAY